MGARVGSCCFGPALKLCTGAARSRHCEFLLGATCFQRPAARRRTGEKGALAGEGAGRVCFASRSGRAEQQKLPLITFPLAPSKLNSLAHR